MQALLYISLISCVVATKKEGWRGRKDGGTGGEDSDSEWYDSLWFFILFRLAFTAAFFFVTWAIIKCCVMPCMQKKRDREVAETVRRHEEERERVENTAAYYRQMGGLRQNLTYQGREYIFRHFPEIPRNFKTGR